MYDPSLGRFISPDAIVQDQTNPQILNRYSYVVNNPLKYTDPSGLCMSGDPANSSYYDCTFDDFAKMPWDQRIEFLTQLEKASGATDWLGPIKAITEAWKNDPDFNDLKGWAALANAGTLLSIQDGYRTSIGEAPIGTDPSGAAARGAWNDFFIGVKAEKGYPDLGKKWADAEGAAVRFGVGKADAMVGRPTGLAGVKADASLQVARGYRISVASGHNDPRNDAGNLGRAAALGMAAAQAWYDSLNFIQRFAVHFYRSWTPPS